MAAHQQQNASFPIAAPRARLLAAATRLFRSNGINATGIDTIIAAARVSKTSLYAHFKSKNELVAAVLEAEALDWQDWFAGALSHGATPREQLDSIFPALKLRLATDGLHGSLLVNAVGEHDRDVDWLRGIAARQHAWLVSRIAGLARAAGAHRPGLLARQMAVLFDGTLAAMMVTRDASIADAAGVAAMVLVDAACATRKRRPTRQIGLQGGAAALAKEDLSEVE